MSTTFYSRPQGIAGNGPQVAALLRKAADTIRELGWRKGYSYGPGSVCMVRAIDVAADTKDPFYGRPGIAEDALHVLRGVTGSGAVGSWNDEHTKRQVLAALEKAAKLLEKDWVRPGGVA